MCVSNMLGTMTSTDTCNKAQSVQDHLPELVFSLCKSMGIPEDQMVMYSGFCYQHMRNIVIANGVEQLMETELTQLLSGDIDLIPRHLRIQCGLSNFARMVDGQLCEGP